MPSSPLAISIGDLARALKKLKPIDDKTRLAIAMVLGMHWETPEEIKPVAKRTSASKVAKSVAPRSQPTFDRSPAPRLLLASRMERTRTEEAAPSIYVPPLEASAPEDETQSPPHDPLFFPRWTRGILSAGLATRSELGPIDIDRVVRILSRGQCLRSFPLLSSPTLSRGIQLLIDRSEAMTPFIKDQIRLAKDISSVVGKDRVNTMRFVGCPGRRAGAGPERSWSRYEPPLPGVPVLLLTDLGIGRPQLSDERSGVAEWLKFAAQVKKAECPLLAFVPYAPARWPPTLMGEFTIIQWDRNTTAITVANRLKREREVRV